MRSSLPSNSLAVLNGLALDCVERKVLGPETRVELQVFDESNVRIKYDRLIRQIKKSGGHALVALVGVQSNQYPRAVDIGRKFRKHDIPVCIGGFHVSGCFSMLPKIQPEIQEAMDLGISLFAGEAEGRLDVVLQDAFKREMRPLYDFSNQAPNIEGAPLPFLQTSLLDRTSGSRVSFDAGRGCPFTCSFCTIINVQGRTARSRAVDDVEALVRKNVARGISNFFIADDNFARNKYWEAILDRLIHLREEEEMEIRFVIQVDTVCHKIPGFIEKSGRAGVTRVFIGLESINPVALQGASKRQNKVGDYRVMMEAWHAVGVLTYAGYILGFPTDTPESIMRDIATIQRELPIDLLEFFILTPLPGSQDHRTLYDKGVEMDSDMNRYDVVHVTTAHQTMSREELLDVYRRAWGAYYSKEHVMTIIQRAKEWGFSTREMMMKLLTFYGVATLEGIHPLEGGLFRLKTRKDRRSTMPRESPFVFYPWYVWQSFWKYSKFIWMYFRFKRIRRKAEKTPRDLSRHPQTSVIAHRSPARKSEKVAP